MDSHHNARSAVSLREELAQRVLDWRQSVAKRVRRFRDNGPCFIFDLFKNTCQQLHLKDLRTRICTPRTNGKAEHFIQTAIREWAYARLYRNSQQRNQQLEPWLHQYNWHRPHASLDRKRSISRSGLDVNNLLRHNIWPPRVGVPDTHPALG